MSHKMALDGVDRVSDDSVFETASVPLKCETSSPTGKGEASVFSHSSNDPHEPFNDVSENPNPDRPFFTGEEKEDYNPSRSKQRIGPLDIFKFADRSDKILMLIGGICAFVGGAGIPAFSFTLGRLLNNLLTEDPEKAARRTALIMVYIGLGLLVALTIHVFCWCVAAQRQVSRIRALYFSAVLRQEIGWHDVHKAGELTARMTGDTRVLQNGINDRFSQGIYNLATGIFGFVFGFILCWELTFVMIGMMPFVGLAGAALGFILASATTETRKQFAVAGSIATEVMENIRTVQVFGNEPYEVDRFHSAIKLSEKPGIKREFMSVLTVGVTLGLVHLTFMVIFFFAEFLLMWGRTNIGDGVAAFVAILFGTLCIGYFFPSLTAFTESRSAAYEIFQTIDRIPDIDVEASGEPVTGFHDAIEFRNVRFSYPARPDQMLFTDLCLTIKKGQKVAFSGSSGCGKSSMIGLLQRFYDPTGGAVLVDGRDMRDLDLMQWRDQIGIVSQEPNLFAGTMLENVRVGRADATLEDVMEACKQASIHDTIMSLPDQYDTPVGAVGSQLSGGQKQRIAIARALIREPAVLLLDEATSALDRKSEVEVQAALDALMEKGQMTVIIIAHRLATIRGVDCIYYVSHDGVEGSAITERGTFDELMERGGAFAVMAQSQGVVHTKKENASSDIHAKGKDEETDDRLNQFLDDEELARLDAEVPRTERQKVPLDELADWEIERTNVSLTRLIAINRKYWWAMVLGLLGSLIAGSIAPINTILLGKLLATLADYTFTGNEAKLRSDMNLYAPLFSPIAVGVLGGWLLQFFYGYAGERLTTRLRAMLFKQVLRQDMSFFDAKGRDAGTLAGMLSGDCEAIHQLCGFSVGVKIQTACTAIVGLIIAFCYQWKIACVTLACLPLIFFGSYMQQQMMVGVNKEKAGDRDETIVTESLSNVRTVVAFNLRPKRVEDLIEHLAKDRSQRYRRNFFVALLYGFSQFSFFGSFALCYWYGGKLIKQGEADFEDVNVATLAVLMGAMSAGDAGGFASASGDARAACRRVFSVIDRVPDVDVEDTENKAAPSFELSQGRKGVGCDIALRRTQFIYPARPNQVVLSSVDLDFRAGTTNGLMGQTGCGKSTTIQLLARFYAHRRGRVLVNSTPIEDLNIALWRRNISIVLQEPDLFSGTVRDNICYSVRDDGDDEPPTDEEVEQVARWACIHDDIMDMPEGYNTDVGYKGRALSGGQKQRVAIARGLLRRRVKVLLLDEATSALDNATEAKVQHGIDQYIATRRDEGLQVTVISIAHRLTTIRYSDQIVLLDSGHIIEQGTHDQLMALSGEYATRWNFYVNGGH